MSEQSQISLGFEVGTGEEVTIPLDHMLITGRTRRSGKTTTLEAIAQRSGSRALTFLTKPGENTFAQATIVRPYFYDQGGWRFVAAVLEATMGEKMKRERAEIIKACQGTLSLRQVYERIVASLARVRSGWTADVLTSLKAYFEIVLPQLEQIDLAPKLELAPTGISVIDLSDRDFSDELRSLIIRSALEWVVRHEKGVLTVIPEAWQFIPNGKGNPVKDGCTALIRMGGVNRNWVAIDSQEITSIDPGIRKSCGVWILGVQSELNEVKRVIEQLPGNPKPTPDSVMQLELGEFYVSYTGARTRKVYVQPTWMTAEDARLVALGDIVRPAAPNLTRQPLDTKSKQKERKEEKPVPEKERSTTDEKLDKLISLLMASQTPSGSASPREPLDDSPVCSFGGDEEALFQRFRTRLLKDPAVLRVLASKPEIVVEIKKEIIEIDGSSLKGRVARLLAQGFFKSARRHSEVLKELQRTGAQVNGGNLSTTLSDFQRKGFLTEETAEGGKTAYLEVPGMKARVVEK